jgi:hypothetical protein
LQIEITQLGRDIGESVGLVGDATNYYSPNQSTTSPRLVRFKHIIGSPTKNKYSDSRKGK